LQIRQTLALTTDASRDEASLRHNPQKAHPQSAPRAATILQNASAGLIPNPAGSWPVTPNIASHSHAVHRGTYDPPETSGRDETIQLKKPDTAASAKLPITSSSSTLLKLQQQGIGNNTY
jgi:hypothetical protein